MDVANGDQVFAPRTDTLHHLAVGPVHVHHVFIDGDVAVWALLSDVGRRLRLEVIDVDVDDDVILTAQGAPVLDQA